MRIDTSDLDLDDDVQATDMQVGDLYVCRQAPGFADLQGKLAMATPNGRVVFLTEHGPRVLKFGDQAFRYRRVPDGTEITLGQGS